MTSGVAGDENRADLCRAAKAIQRDVLDAAVARTEHETRQAESMATALRDTDKGAARGYREWAQSQKQTLALLAKLTASHARQISRYCGEEKA